MQKGDFKRKKTCPEELAELKELQKVTEFSTAGFHGFTLKNGYWYGYTKDDVPVATSTWVREDGLVLYVKVDEYKWEQRILPPDRWSELPDALASEVTAKLPG